MFYANNFKESSAKSAQKNTEYIYAALVIMQKGNETIITKHSYVYLT